MHSLEALKHLVAEMTSSSKRILEYSRNRSATGLHRERILEAYIKKIAPKSFGIGSGFLYGDKKSSKQIDILVYDQDNFAPLFDEGGYKVVIPESTIHTIEVKSKLNKGDLVSAFENVLSATSMNKKIHGSIFGFDGMSANRAFKEIGNIIKKHKDLPNLLELLPRSIVCLNKWVIVFGKNGQNYQYKHFYEKPFEEQFLFFFVELYYSMYGYRRRLYPDNKLPKLKDQGFGTSFMTGKHATLSISKK